MKSKLKYITLFLVLISLIMVFMPGWREADMKFYGWLSEENLPNLDDNIVLVHVPYNTNIGLYRKSVASLLTTFSEMADERPDVVVLDMWFSDENAGKEYTINSLNRALESGIKVYATVNNLPIDSSGGQMNVGDYMDVHAKEIYDILGANTGHTIFEYYHSSGTLSYPNFLPRCDDNTDAKTRRDRTCFVSNNANETALWALPFIFIEDRDDHFEEDESGNYIQETVEIPVGLPEKFNGRLLGWLKDENTDQQNFKTLPTSFLLDPELQTGTACSEGEDACEIPDLRGKTVIVGSLIKDHGLANIINETSFMNRTGPELVAWAISDLEAAQRFIPERKAWLGNGAMLVALVIFSTLIVAIFNGILRKFPFFKGQLMAAAFITLLFGVGFLALSVFLVYKFGYIFPRVSLPSIAMLFSTGLVWYEKSQLQSIWFKPVEEEYYDVFISYSHKHRAWVRKHVSDPLKREIKTNGKPFKIFFDDKSIRGGVGYYKKLARGVNNSKLFIPVITKDYFERPYCKKEMEWAAIKNVGKEDFIFPIVRNLGQIPIEYKEKSFPPSVDQNPEFLQDIIKVIREFPD